MMKVISRILFVALVMVLIFNMTALASASAYFPDVPPDAPYADAVNTLAQMGIIVGDQNGNFNPSSTLTRAEFATMMCRVLGVEDQAKAITTSSFSDVPSNFWGCGYITEAVNLGLVSGYGNGKFGPNDPLTYEQAVKVLVCAWGYGDDAVAAGGWPNGYVIEAENLGITQGTTVSDQVVLRSTVAILVYNITRLESNNETK